MSIPHEKGRKGWNNPTYVAVINDTVDKFLADLTAAIYENPLWTVLSRSAEAKGTPPLWTPHSCPRGVGEQGNKASLLPLHRLGSFHSRQGAESSRLRRCGPHQPLDPSIT